MPKPEGPQNAAAGAESAASPQPRRTASGTARRTTGPKRWSRRFLQEIEGYTFGDRFSRELPLGGHEVELAVHPGEATALVRGIGARPCNVTIHAACSPSQWARLEREVAARAGAVADLLDGRMPAQIDEIFESCELRLFPAQRDFKADCTCSDRIMPCRHVAAACAALARRFDEDPIELLVWRGRARADLLHRVEALRDEAEWAAADRERAADGPALARRADSFWDCPAPPPGPPPSHGDRPPGAVLDRFGPVGVAVHGHDVADLLRAAYEAMARR